MFGHGWGSVRGRGWRAWVRVGPRYYTIVSIQYNIYIYIIVINNRPVDAFYFSLTLVRSDNTRIIWRPIEVAPVEIAVEDRRRTFIGSKVVYAAIRVILYYFFTRYLSTKKYIIICDLGYAV